jgi:hypothetical protein
MRLRLHHPPGEEELAARLQDLPRAIDPPPDLWDGVASRLAAPRLAPDRDLPALSRAWGLRDGVARTAFLVPRSRWGVRPALAAGLALCASGVLWLRATGRHGWRIAEASGAYSFAAGRLVTAPTARVRLEVGRIGEVDVAPDSRVRLLAATPVHRLALDRGAIEARISSPPRLFYVETPAATAVDLGCAYAMTVDSSGGSLVHVTLGWVELRSHGRVSVVPFNMSAYTRPGAAPGTPFSNRAADSLKAALFRFDFEHAGERAVATVLHASTPDDAVTLWHLLSRTDGATRASVYSRLATLVPPPAGVTEARVLALDGDALRTWWDALPGSPGTAPWWQRAAVRLAAWLGVL